MISSLTNPRIQRVSRLRKRGRRDRVARLLVEGHRAVSAAWEAGALEQVLYRASAVRRHGQLLDRIRDAGGEVWEVDDAVMSHLTSSASAPSILGVARIPRPGLGDASTGVALADIRDPGVVGSVLALTAAVGGEAAVMLPGCADAFGPKVVRAAAGAHFLTRVVPMPDRETGLSALRTNGATIVGLASDAAPIWEVELPARSVLLVDAGGATSEADVSVRIPIERVRPSLAVLAGMVLYEWVRQRGTGT